MQNMVSFRPIYVELWPKYVLSLEFLNFYIIIRFKILLIGYLNELIDFSMSFPFYRRLNPLFDELFNKDTTLSIGRIIFCARAGWGPPARGDPLYACREPRFLLENKGSGENV